MNQIQRKENVSLYKEIQTTAYNRETWRQVHQLNLNLKELLLNLDIKNRKDCRIIFLIDKNINNKFHLIHFSLDLLLNRILKRNVKFMIMILNPSNNLHTTVRAQSNIVGFRNLVIDLQNDKNISMINPGVVASL